MADPATDTTYPLAIDPLPEILPTDKQNAPGIEHDEMHNRANAILNALQALVGTEGAGPEDPSILGRLAALGAGGTPEMIRTDVSYTLALADAFAMVCMDNATPCEVVVPAASTVAFAPGTRIDLSWDGAGQVSVVPASGVIIRTPETLKLRKRWAKASLIRRAALDTWDLEGNLEAAP